MAINRVEQYVLILAFLSGGYMVSRAGLSTVWMIVSVALVLVLFAMAGMMGRPFKQLKAGGAGAEPLRKLRTFSIVAAISYLLLIVIMTNPTLL